MITVTYRDKSRANWKPATRYVRLMDDRLWIVDRDARGWEILRRVTEDPSDIPDPYRTEAVNRQYDAYGISRVPLGILKP
jgi:hypothetical protein